MGQSKGKKQTHKLVNRAKAERLWAKAEVGVYGLKEISFYEFGVLPTEDRKELIDQMDRKAVILTSCGVPVLVVQSLEEYLKKVAVNPNPKRVPKMTRIAGIMYREVV